MVKDPGGLRFDLDPVVTCISHAVYFKHNYFDKKIMYSIQIFFEK